MRHSLRGPGLVALAALLSACADDVVAPVTAVAPEVAPAAATLPPVRISEFHYDNASTDAGEAIEVMGPAGTDLAGWSLVLYNGSNGTAYNTRPLSGTIAASCDGEGVLTFTYPANGIQNGDPDGIALVDPSSAVVEFISYEGVFTAVGGPADGMVSTDVGARQTGGANGTSVQRNGFGGWSEGDRNFGACNGQPVVYDGPTTVVINELMGNPLGAASASWGEWFEVHNYGDQPVNLGGWSIRSGNDTEHTIGGEVIVPAGGHAVLGRGADETRNGHVTLQYNYFTNATTIWLDASDWLALDAPDGAMVDSVQWAGTPAGATRAVRDASLENAGVDGADAVNWGYSTTPFGSGDFGTPGAPNGTLADAAPPVPAGVVRLVFGGRDGGDPPLPVGFEAQLFVDALDRDGEEVATTITWSSATPALASVDQDGVIRALGEGAALIRATTGDGRVGLYRVATRLPTPGLNAVYAGNTEFGAPTDADASDDLIIERPGLTSSYSVQRNTPNWVSFAMEATHYGPEDRCNCFTQDPEVAELAAPITTASYTGAGAYHGYLIDRGHLARSADRTAGSLDNAHTFYFSNIIPQAADNNQGPWGRLETHLGNLAQNQNREVYVIAGAYGSRGTIKDEGKITIPASVWKVAVIMPRDRGLADVDAADDFQLVAVDMPNVAGIRPNPWEQYATTVDAIERASGYDVLARLPDHVEWLVEAGVMSPSSATAPQLIAILQGGIRSLVASRALPAGIGDSFLSKLVEAEAQLAAGDVSDAAAAVRAIGREADALVRAGRLTRSQVDSLKIVASWIVQAIG